MRPSWLATDAGNTLRPGDRLIARFTLDELPPGKYRLAVSLGAMRSEAEWFLVSNGTETNGLRRELARYNVDRSQDADALRKNLLTLAAADPLNASPWIRLGDLALKEGSAEQIRAYYALAPDFAQTGRRQICG